MKKENEYFKYKGYNHSRKICLKAVCTLVCCIVLCSCGQSDEGVKKEANKSNNSNKVVETATESPDVLSETPIIELDRLHIEDGCLKSVDGLYEKEETLKIPEEVSSIDNKALVYNRENGNKDTFTSSQTLHIQISSKVKLSQKNFYNAGPLDITFEEGRKIIEKGAFSEAGCSGKCVKVTLPSSIIEIKERAFYNYLGKITLNDGLKKVDSYGLAYAKCDLPDSIEFLGNHALDRWEPSSIESSAKKADIKDFKLPKNLKYIGDDSIKLAYYYPSNTVYLSDKVEHIGKNAFEFLVGSDVPENRMPKVKFKVDKNNKRYYSDKKGNICTNIVPARE
ncbi:leucine-rich repeat domain-containing protein [Eubacterium xylanophilum]|uniref:leucine-rich repeat domain-containing protein n=1 Tax=Eubacterium xylanophilum TaxID=39497 RepID=UPI00047EF4C5|nr:leucine-rich repeat domain-containing protein [Eubacterium xylanophilum]